MTALESRSGNRTAAARTAYRAVVVIGMVAVMAISAAHYPGSAMASGVTIAFALGLAVRYWWVIRLLPWPFTVPRITLLIAMWAAVDAVALNAGDPAAWAWSFVIVFVIGAATELYNYATRQWAVGSPAFERSLRTEHVRGAASAVIAAGATATMIVTGMSYTPALLAALVLIDWLRLAEMVRRHRRLLETKG